MQKLHAVDGSNPRPAASNVEAVSNKRVGYRQHIFRFLILVMMPLKETKRFFFKTPLSEWGSKNLTITLNVFFKHNIN